MIKIENLQKKYAGNWALRGISLQIAAGKVTGILGENGSGKSTLFKILAGVVRPSGGHVSIRGESLGGNTRRQTAYLPEVDPFYNWMQVGEQLQFLASFYTDWDWNKTDELLQIMGISKAARIGT